jgi:hypothetical protein
MGPAPSQGPAGGEPKSSAPAILRVIATVFAKRIFFYGDFAIRGTAAVRMGQARWAAIRIEIST